MAWLTRAEQARVQSAKEYEPLAESRLTAKPFDPHTEVLPDAKKIVLHLWTILIVLPLAIGILFVIVTAR